jgi:dipeptidyl aminopeptidase/acylaminoacyl peptidase
MMKSSALRMAALTLVAANALAHATPSLAAPPAPIGARAKRPFTIDDLLAIETIGAVMFSPDGSYVLFEKIGSRKDSGEAGRPIFHGQQSARIYIAARAEGWRPRPLFEQKAGDGFTLRSISPDGRLVVVSHAASGSLRYEVVDVEGGSVTPLAGTPDLRWSHGPQQPVWVGARQLIYATTARGLLPSLLAGHAEAQETLAASRATMRAGQVATAQVFGDQATNRPENQGALIAVDVTSGTVRTLARGNFVAWFVSQDRKWVAGVSTIERPLDAAVPIDEHIMPTGLERRLELVELAGEQRMQVCPDCDVSPGKVAWSADGRKLGFFARKAGGDWRSGALMSLDLKTGALTTAIDRPPLNVSQYPLDPTWVWCGDGIEIAQPSRPTSCAPKWQDVARRLAPELPASSFRPWRARMAFNFAQSLSDARAEEVSVLQAPGEHGAVFLTDDAGGAGWDRIEAPGLEAQPVALSPAARAAVFLEHPGNSTVLTLRFADGSSKRLVQLNEGLTRVAESQAVKIEHRGPDGEALISWLLLPAGRAPGERLPVICKVYSGYVGRDAGPNAPLWDDLELNPHLYTAHGYAVLIPSLPFPGPEGEREPAANRAALILSAVDAAAAKGYVDPTRLGITGQSNGAYTVAVALTQTDRFSAGLAEAGLYDLASAYGQLDITQTMSTANEGIGLNMASGLEMGQQGLGVGPWVDPAKYVRNSPTFAADRIHTPLMLVHGDLDRLAAGQAEELFTALHRLGRQTLLIKYAGEGHVIWSAANIRDKWERQLAWFDAHLGLKPRPD